MADTPTPAGAVQRASSRPAQLVDRCRKSTSRPWFCQMRPRSLSPEAGFALVAGFVLGLAACVPAGAGRHPVLAGSFLGAAAVLAAWSAGLYLQARRRGRRLPLEIALRPQHYVQACAQASVLLYWGWHWPPVGDAAVLIAGQVLFACALELLVGWSRGEAGRIGFGPVPVVFSINLFLWFADDWFHLQFLLVALGFAAKALIRWERDGRRVHVFNPASFPLAVFALALILTGMSGATRAQDIAITQFYPPNMHLWIFLVALPGQYLFGVAPMTLAAVVTTWLLGLAYFAATGVYFFYDAYIPAAVFLGMHLLFTDPSTAPRTELGRLLFGVFYGAAVVVLYGLLARAGAPTFYDKLLPVPLLNLSVIFIDRLARSRVLRRLDPANLGRVLAPRRRHLAHMAAWTVVFAVLHATGGVGDRHAGQWLPFWREACAEARPGACRYLAARQSGHCAGGSGWACNETGILLETVPGVGETGAPPAPDGAAAWFERGCALGFEPACRNLRRPAAAPFERAPPAVADYPIVLRGSKGPVADRTPAALYARACRQGWPDTCGPAE